MPAGRVQWFDQEQSIRVVGSQPSLADLANLPIALSDYRKVKLAELATISDSHADVRSRTRLNGREVLGFQVFRSKAQAIRRWKKAFSKRCNGWQHRRQCRTF